ncbi:MAG: FAD-dependent monooxygenase, partial [Alphaproteobacteria bacterium]|nr:FAD-dependent monooxygenase [Alphaproteobacteria bacterium]
MPRFEATRPAELNGPQARHGVVIVGAGPIGLVAALDLAAHGIPCTIIDDDDTVSVGSRAICWAKRTLEILDRLGIARPLVDKGVTWETGKVFSRERELYTFDLANEGRQQFPAFINLQQYHVEEVMVGAVTTEPQIDLRWKNRLVGLTPGEDHVTIDVETPFGNYSMEADWVIAADGARSQTRRLLGLDFLGRVFEDRFLIADVVMRAEFPSQRWFWFDPPFNPEQSALLHKQADNVWRIDLQLGGDADPERERKPEQVIPRIERMLGPDVPFDLEWTSVYTFQCRRLEKFRHGRVIFAGDAAHQVSPFGARGANSGIQDVDNLVWK